MDASRSFEQNRADAEKGNAHAQSHLGYCYNNGEGVAKNEVKAAKWYRKAAEQNYAPAQFCLAGCYYEGQGVAQDYVEALKWFRIAAEQNLAVAQYCLARCYANGQGIAKDDVEALKWYREAADRNYPEAQFDLGVCYANGRGVTQDWAEAAAWWRKVAEQNHTDAQYWLGFCYDAGRGIAQDRVEAVKWYHKAADQNHPEAQYNLGLCCADGKGLAKDEAEAVKWYRKAADQNLASAQNELGSCSEHGRGVAKNEIEAVKWYSKAADQNYSEAQFNLGLCYAVGKGVRKDDAKALEWYRMAANQNHAAAQNVLRTYTARGQGVASGEQNDAQAQYNQGVCYFNGQGVAKDHAEAAKWFRKAAERNHPDAQYWLGVCCFNGECVPKHPDPVDAVITWGFSLLGTGNEEGAAKTAAEAVQWFRKAAEQGNAGAQNKLGCCYEEGSGVEEDLAEAAKWFRKAAEQGNAFGQSNLGSCYDAGRGVPKNFVEAYKWHNLASAQGFTQSKIRLSWLERFMTREQIAEAQRRANEFKPRKAPVPGAAVTGRDVVDSNPAASATGFFISEDGFLVTNEHVIQNATQICVVTSGGSIPAIVVKVDKPNDLALLKAEGRFAPLPIAWSRGVKLGGTVATVGFPNIGLQGSAPKLAKGEIASLSGVQDDARYFQVSLPVQPGNSGGALVDECGNVVGVVAAKLSPGAALITSGSLPENVNYAVKSSYLLSFLESVPEVSAKLKEANTKEIKFEDVVKSAEQAAVLVLVY